MKKQFVPFNKLSKKAQKAILAEQRILAGFNTGDRIHADKRRQQKNEKKSWESLDF